MKVKTQSSLEYMMTYGWAILIIVLVAAVLYSFGVFNPSSNVTNAPLITGFSDVPITNAAVNGSYFKITITNQQGSSIRINNASLLVGSTTYTQSNCTAITLQPGQYVGCYVKGSFQSGTVSANGYISYTTLTGTKQNLTTTGTIRVANSNTPIYPGASSEYTNFTESGLPLGTNSLLLMSWNVTYGGVTNTSARGICKSCVPPVGGGIWINNITFSTFPGTYSFSVPIIKNSTGQCTTTYAPNVTSGNLAAGSLKPISFSSSTSCISVFTESGIPVGTNGGALFAWNATYDGINKKSANTLCKGCLPINGFGYWANTINFTTQQGSHSYSIENLSNSTYDYIDRYTANSTSGSLTAGNNKSLSFLTDYSVIFAYAANPAENIVSAINASSNTLIKNITIGTEPGYVTLSTNGEFLYVQNYESNTTSVINTTSNTLLNTINDYGTGTSENHSTGVTYFLNASDGYPKGTVFVPGTPGIDDVGLINASNNDFVGERGPSSPTTGGVIIQQCLNISNPPTNISCEGYVLSQFDAAYIGTGSYVPLTANGSGIALERWGSEANKIAYVSLPKQNMVVVLNVSSVPGSICSGGHCYTPNLIIANITSPSGSPTAWFNGVNAVQFNPNGRLAYVLNTGGAGIGVYVSVINVTTSKIITNVTLTTNSGAQGEDLAVTPDGNYAYISYYSTAGGDRISVINLNTYSTTLISGVASGAGTYFGIAAAARDESI